MGTHFSKHFLLTHWECGFAFSTVISAMDRGRRNLNQCVGVCQCTFFSDFFKEVVWGYSCVVGHGFAPDTHDNGRRR